MAKVTLLFGSDPQGEFSLNRDELRIGRARDCDIVVDNLGVSRHHCSIVRGDGHEWRLVDQGSNNGTFLNGEKVHESHLANGDRIVLGKFSLVYDAHGEAVSDPGQDGGSAAGMGGEMTMFVDPEAIKKMQSDIGSGAAQQQRMVLSVQSGGRSVDCPLVKSDTSLGKGEDADIIVKGFLVKPIQAKVLKTDGGHRIISLGGWRKLRVNGIVVHEGLLRDGDQLRLAGTTIVYRKA